MFNTLKYAKILEEAGLTRHQAEVSIKILVEIMEDKLASKQDFKDFKTEMRQDLKNFRVEMQHTILQLENKLTIRMGAMLAASIAVLTAIQKLT